MHVAIVHSRFILYWPARIRALAVALSSRGDRLSVIETSDRVKGYEFASSPEFSSARAGHHQLSSCHSTRMIVAHLEKLFAKLAPDIVVGAPITTPEGCAAVRWCKSNGKGVIIMDDARMKDVSRSYVVNACKRLIYRNVDAVLIPASSHSDSYIRWGIDGGRIFYGIDVVDNEWYAQQGQSCAAVEGAVRARLKLPDKFFLGIGRQVSQKNWPALLSAYLRYRKKARNNTWGLVLVGNGPERAKLQEQVNRSGIEGAVFRPWGTPEEICTYYALGTVFVLPSRYGETWGLVVNEAMACGLPILVSTHCGCSRTLVREGENGWSFSPDDPDQLARLMNGMAHLSDEDRRMMGSKSKSIIADWSIGRFVQGLLSAIDFCKERDRQRRYSTAGRILLSMWHGRR